MAFPAVASVGTFLSLGSATSAAVPVPSGVAADDIVVVLLYLEANRTVTAPAGFNAVAGNPSATSNQWEHLFWKRATAADTGTYDFTWTTSATRSARAFRITGATTTGTPYDTPSRAARSASSATTPAVSVTTAGPERLVLWFATGFNAGTWTPPSGYTEHADNGEITAASVTQAAAGSTGSVTGTESSAGPQTAALLAFIPDSAPVQSITPTVVATPSAPGGPTLTQSGVITLAAPLATPTAPAAPTVVPGTVTVTPTALTAPAAPGAPAMTMTVAPTTLAAPATPGAPSLFRAARPPLRVDFWALDDDGSILCPLPHPVSWDLSLIPGEVGSVRIEYPVDGLNYDVLNARVNRERDLYIHIRTDGTLLNTLGAILQSRDGDQVSEAGTVTFTGSFLTQRLEEARLRYNSADDKGETIFSAANAGDIMNYVLDAAQARGTLHDLWWSFTGAVDSRGTPWPGDTDVSCRFPARKTLLELAQQLRDWGMCEFEVTTDLEVRLYVPETVGADHTLADPPIVLRRGRDLLESPRRTDLRSSITDLEVTGADGVSVTLHDASARARRGRQIEGAVSEGNLTDTGSATAYGQVELARTVFGVDELTHTLTFDQNHPTPLRELFPADWVYTDTGDGSGVGERERIVQLTVSQQRREDRYSGGVVLRDLITDREVSLQRQLDRFSAGSAIPGTSEPPVDDTSTPVAPVGVVVNSLAYQQGIDTYASLQVSWSAVTQNVDGSAATDIAGYRVQWRLTSDLSGAWTLGADTPSTSANFGGVAAGEEVQVRVAAYDRDGNQSAWSAVVGHLTETDTTAPPTPSTPSVSNYLGVLLVEWNGLGSAGETMPLDFDYVEIHMSTSSGFTPTTATYVDRLYGAGVFPVADLPYGVTQFFKLVAVDRTAGAPNKSAASGAGSAAPEQVVSADVFDGAIGSAKLADLAVTTAKINDLAVNNAKIGDLSVGKLTAGTFSAALTLSGIFRTGMSPNARGEWDSTSFRQYNASNQQTLAFVPGGVSFMTGEFRTALTGQRLVLNPGGSTPDEVRIYPTGGGDFARINARTAPADGSAAIIIDGGASGGNGRGRFAAYKAEAAVGWVVNDTGGDIENGYSRTAVSCSQNVVGAWAQTQLYFDRYSGSTRQPASRYVFKWTSGDAGSNVPTLVSENNSGIKLDAGAVGIVNSAGNGYVPCVGTSFTEVSSQEAKQDIMDLRAVLDPLAVIRQARAYRWRYRDEVAADGDAAPVRFGPIAEQLPTVMHRHVDPAGDGGYLAVSLGDRVGLVWGAVNQLLDQEPRSVQGRATLTGGTTARRQVTVAWDEAPLGVPTDVTATAIASMPTAAGRLRARVVPGTVTLTGCTVEIIPDTGLVPVLITAALPVTVEVTGRYTYLPPLEGAA